MEVIVVSEKQGDKELQKQRIQQKSNEKCIIKELLVCFFIIFVGILMINPVLSTAFMKVGVICILSGLMAFAVVVFINLSAVSEVNGQFIGKQKNKKVNHNFER